jgi:hypothetical protein
VREVHGTTIDVIGEERAARAALFPVGPEHEVIHDQLAAAVEQLGERLFAVRAVEGVLLVDFHPGQLASLARERITLTCERLLLCQMFAPRLQPLLARHDLV